jgi:4'-phosphopantetheinyl transferase
MSISSDVEVVTARLDPGPHALRALSRWLCEAERSRVQRLRFERDRRRFIVARARLRGLLAARLGAAPESIEFVYGAQGKPALAKRFAASGWRFNLSHREDLAVYAFSRAGEVGIDVEAVHAVREADDIAARVFSTRENQAYRALAPRDRALGFFRCWTRKEAFVKALGEGLSMPLAEVDVSAAPPGWRLHSFSPLRGFIAALAHR